MKTPLAREDNNDLVPRPVILALSEEVKVPYLQPNKRYMKWRQGTLSSAEFHEEWKARDRHVLDKCGNPLHRGHRMPHRGGISVLGTYLIELLVREASRRVEHYTTVTNQQLLTSTLK